MMTAKTPGTRTTRAYTVTVENARMARWWLATIQLALTSGSISTVSRSKARYQRAGTVKIVLQSSREEGVRWRSLARAGSHETNSVSYKVRQYRPYHIFVLEVVTV